MILLLSCLLLQSELPREIEDLVRRLNADGLEEREQATSRLKEIGTPAIPALEVAAKSGEAEARGRARLILDHLARLDRVKALRPASRKLTVDLKDAPLADAVRQVLHPFGLTGATFEEELAKRRVTLTLKDASLWSAVDQLEEAAGLRWDYSSSRLTSVSTPRGVRCGSGTVRIAADGWGGWSSGGVSRKLLLLRAWTPPGSWACDADVSDLEVTDEAGKPVAHQWHPELEGRREEGRPSELEFGRPTFDEKDLKGKKSLRLRGTLCLAFPRDIDRRVMAGIPGKVTVPAGTIEIDRLTRRGKGEWSYGIGGSSTGGRIVALVSIEDEKGRWLGDLGTIAVSRGSSLGTGSSVDLLEGNPAKGIVTLADGVEFLRETIDLTVDLSKSD